LERFIRAELCIQTFAWRHRGTLAEALPEIWGMGDIEGTVPTIQPLRGGEVVSTGTLTLAMPVSAGES
jgi:hypothetical protein